MTGVALSTAVLCDFAQVRDGLLFVSSGAISRLYRRTVPSPLGLMVGLVIEIPIEEAGGEHEVVAQVINRHGDELAVVNHAFRVGDHDLFPHEVQQAPMVVTLTGVEAVSWGTHQVRLYVDDVLERTLTCYVVPSRVGAVPRRTEPAPEQGTEARAEAGNGAQPEGDGEVEGEVEREPAGSQDVDAGAAPEPAPGDGPAPAPAAVAASVRPDRGPSASSSDPSSDPYLRPLPTASALLLRARRAWQRRT